MAKYEPDPTTRIRRLARTFPSLNGAPCVDPWDPDGFDRWATGLDHATPARLAAVFVLEVWEFRRLWRAGLFQAVFALAVWGKADRAAFLAWAADPYWFGDLRWQATVKRRVQEDCDR
jgi:hypothetical protein